MGRAKEVQLQSGTCNSIESLKDRFRGRERLNIGAVNEELRGRGPALPGGALA
jgi:hypothetical protein